MNSKSWRDTPKWGASYLAWQSCQAKPCEWVWKKTRVNLWRLQVVVINFWVLLPLLTLLDSPVVELKNFIHFVHLCILCGEKPKYFSRVWFSSVSHDKNALFFTFFFVFEVQHANDNMRSRNDKLRIVRAKNTANMQRNIACEWHIMINFILELLNYS